MPSILQIKKRINTIQGINKITRAMLLISTAKLKKAKRLFESSRAYYDSISRLSQELFSQVGNLRFLKTNDQAVDDLYVLIGSNNGLAGGYNYNVIRKFRGIVKPNDSLITIGTKMRQSIKYLGNVEKHIEHFFFNEILLDYKGASLIGNRLYQHALSGKFRKIVLLYSNFVNAMTFNPLELVVYPIQQPSVSEVGSHKVTYFEPSAEQVARNFLPIYFNAIIHSALMESFFCENASRRNAMDNAFKNGDALKQKLILDFNRQRQSMITNEINEIVGGSRND